VITVTPVVFPRVAPKQTSANTASQTLSKTRQSAYSFAIRGVSGLSVTSAGLRLYP